MSRDADFPVSLPPAPDPADAVPTDSRLDVLGGGAMPFGKFRVKRMIGRGGMGAVYEAEDPTLGRTVALKVILPGAAGDVSRRVRFRREARAAAAVAHDNVVTVYEVGEVDDTLYLAMEFLTGETLEERLHRGTVSLAEAVRIGREVAAGLGAAHAAGLVHRDLKPGNVWLDARTGRARILDFGLALSVADDDRVTAPGFTVGTPAYMAPEQAAGKPVDQRADLFSLGAILYRMVTGSPAFAGSNVLAVLSALAVTAPRPVRSVRPGVPPALAALVDRLLAKEPADRPARAADVVDELGRIEAALTPADAFPAPSTQVAVPASPPRSARRWVLPAVVAAGVAVGAGVGTGLWLALGGGDAGPPGSDAPGPASVAVVPPPTAATPNPDETGWKPLFNGKDLTGWSRSEWDPMTEVGGWAVKDGKMVGRPGVELGTERSRWIITDDWWADVEVRLEYRFTVHGSEGALGLRAVPGSDPTSDAVIVGLIDDENFERVHGRPVHGAFRSGTVHGVFGSKPSNAPIGEWNTLRVEFRGTKLRNWVNGGETIQVDFREAPPDAGPAAFRRPDGRLALRAYHGEMEVRRIDVRPPRD